MRYSFISITPIAFASAMAIGTAFAADLTAADVKTKLEAAGYSDVREVRREHGHFDAEATKDGKEVHLDVDAKTGAIKPETEGDEEHEKH